MTDSQTSKALAEFASEHGLAFAAEAELPREGSTLSREGAVAEAAASGSLPSGIEGTLAHFSYVYTWTDSDNNRHSETRRFTLVVTRVPESIGFVPYLGFSGAASKFDEDAGGEDMVPIDMKKSEVLRKASASAYKGTRESWLAQLFSPALIQWLERCDEDFGFELAGGVLCVGRMELRTSARELEAICADAAHLARAIRQESLEEVGTGGEAEAARDPDADDPRLEAALAAVPLDPPANVAAAQPAFAAHLRRTPATLGRALRSGLLWTLLLNVPAVAIPIVLLSQGLYLPLAIYEAALVALISFFVFRHRVRNEAARAAAEAFYRAYAASRELELAEPLRFAAEHAEAELPFKPDRVLRGPLPGGASGALVLLGDGSKRSDRIAVVAGPRGPIAEAELQAEAPGLSAATLDMYAEQLAGEIKFA